MKEHIDLFETFKGEFIGGLKFKNKLIRKWETETIDGVEVLKSRFMIYPNIKSSDSTVKNRVLSLCKMLGIKNQIESADFSPIAGYYLWFNPDKGEGQEDLIREIMAEKIDEFCPRNEWNYSTINYIEKTDPTKFKTWTKEQILEYIDNDYRKIFDKDNGFVAGETIEETAMGKYVLFDDDNEFEVIVVSSQVTAVPFQNPNVFFDTKEIRHTGLSIEIKYRRIVADINPNGSLMNAIKEEQEEYRLKVLAELQKSNTGPVFYSEDGGMFGQKEKLTNEIWYKDRLRLSVLKGGSGLRNKEVMKILLSTLDTGQIKKKVKWYKKVLGFVLIVIAIVLAVLPGTQLAAGALASVALYVGVAVLIMTLIQAQWAKTNSAAAGYMGRWVRIGNIISTIAGIGAIVQNAVKNAAIAAQAAGKEGTKQAVIASATKEVAKMTFTEQLKLATNHMLTEIAKESLVDMALNYIKSNLKSVAMKVAETVINMRQMQMESKLNEARAQAEESEKAYAEMNVDKNLHVGLEDIKTYREQLVAIHGRYDYDDIYTAEPATHHIGNICKPSTYNAFSLNLRAEDLMKS